MYNEFDKYINNLDQLLNIEYKDTWIEFLAGFVKYENYLKDKITEDDELNFSSQFKRLESEERSKPSIVFRGNEFNYLHYAVIMNRLEIIKSIFKIDSNFPINQKNSKNISAIGLAALFNHAEIFSYLLEIGADIKSEPILFLITIGRGNSTDVLRKYLSLKLIDYKDLLIRELIRYSKDSTVLRIMVENGFDLNTTYSGENLSTIILNINEIESIDKTKYILENKIDINYKSVRLKTPIYEVIQLKHFEILKLYVENGANLNYLNNDGYTPLDYFVVFNNYNNLKKNKDKRKIKDMVEYLIKNGAKFEFICDRSMLQQFIIGINYKFKK
jgi:ankyrin repeat protein